MNGIQACLFKVGESLWLSIFVRTLLAPWPYHQVEPPQGIGQSCLVSEISESVTSCDDLSTDAARTNYMQLMCQEEPPQALVSVSYNFTGLEITDRNHQLHREQKG